MRSAMAFRPGSAHDALDAPSAYAIERREVNWILDADNSRLLRSISRDWLIRFLASDWRPAGVAADKEVAARRLEEGRSRRASHLPTAQGSVISPVLGDYLPVACCVGHQPIWRPHSTARARERDQLQYCYADVRRRPSSPYDFMERGEVRFVADTLPAHRVSRQSERNRRLTAAGEGRPAFDFLGLKLVVPEAPQKRPLRAGPEASAESG